MKWMKKVMAIVLSAVTAIAMPTAAFAKKTTESGSVFIRARLDYSTASGIGCDALFVKRTSLGDRDNSLSRQASQMDIHVHCLQSAFSGIEE